MKIQGEEKMTTIRYNNNIGTPIYAETTVEELRKMPEFAEISDRIIFRGLSAGTDESQLEIRDVAYANRGGCAPDLIYGLKRVQELVNLGVKISYNVYSDDEIAENPRLADARVYYFPCGDESKPFVVFISGGGFEDNWNITQAFPCCAMINELGYNAFALDYRVIRKGEKGLMPAPFEDVAAAIKFIFSHKELFKVNYDNYAVSGLSAGGTCAAEWGTDNFGYKVYGMPKPAALLLGYPVTVFTPDSIERLLNNIVGDDRSAENCSKYCVLEHVDSDYPPAFVYHTKNDKFVPFNETLSFIDKLNEKHIDNKLKAVEKGHHGYAIGNGTMSEGWINEAISFWEAHMK